LRLRLLSLAPAPVLACYRLCSLVPVPACACALNIACACALNTIRLCFWIIYF